VLQAHVFVPGPVVVHVAFAAQPPLFIVHELIWVQVIPSPLYPGLQAQLTALGPVDVHWALVAQPPLLIAHPLIPVHVLPSPV
jgi:hypothetical protein